MDDYSALAQRISVSVSGVSGALILSRDGLVLGAYPNEDDSLAKPAWLKFITLGEPDKSFVEFPDQVWAYVKRGPYAAFATAEVGTRPGILVDQMEQVLLMAEEGRARRDTLRVPDANAAPSGKPRTSLHPPEGTPAPAEVVAGPATAPADDPPSSANGGSKGGKSGTAAPLTAAEAPDAAIATPPPEGIEPAPPAESQPAPAAAEAVPSALKKEPQKLAGSAGGEGFDKDAEVDRVLLAKEFSGLLQVDSDDDEGSS
ncbi:MAG: hypothetical protein OEW46_10235 [Actinomycetota bacterium]|nr:hypothetical protein [Actinomycetota bacterium]